MSVPRHLLVLIAASMAASSLWAAEPATPPAQQVPAKPEAASAKPAATTATKPELEAAAKPDVKDETKPADGAQAAAKPAEKGAAASASEKAASPQRFIPSEQVRADFDVSFPIDI